MPRELSRDSAGGQLDRDRVEGHVLPTRHVHPDVHVRGAPEVPGQARSLEAEAVPEIVALAVPGLEERETARGEPALGRDRERDGCPVLDAERFDEDFEQSTGFLEPRAGGSGPTNRAYLT